MKRFILFAYNHYYPNGGLNDLIDAHGWDTLAEAKDSLAEVILKTNFDVYQIVDRTTMQVIKEVS